ncbi:uncharacterized protein CDV56_105329 [Aspergillus thermomutatus]|uniref:Uncharacterized protein n=1 Tax=Aspergillus thermomutatus TaxID=41047 RepID=A0A397GCI7_ASPTH|nr:uncharacterized protein CDV56_105329 [Aspergillus thermomutatus]RHZ47819.1 hypothetical protein CDV56_105329 [Aspergillus thermomutatus]
MQFPSLRRIRALWSNVLPVYLSSFLSPGDRRPIIIRFLIATKAVFWRIASIGLKILPPRLRSRLQPREPVLFFQCSLVTFFILLLRFDATHIHDHSTVSGYYGPGAFWAWIITCVMAFGPAEGRILLRRIWSDPFEGLGERGIIDLPHPWEDRTNSSSESSCQGQGAPEEDGIKPEKLAALRKMLDCLFLLLRKDEDEIQKLPYPLVRLLRSIARGASVSGEANYYSLFTDYRSFIATPGLSPEYAQQVRRQNEKAMGERAEKILDFFPCTTKRHSNDHPGFIEYRLECRGGTVEAYHGLLDDISTVFPWFDMNVTDFIIHLIDLRNRLQFLEYRRRLTDLPARLDTTACTAMVYPLIACCVQLRRHFPFKKHEWGAEDQAVASVAQISIALSTFAFLSNRPFNRWFTWRIAAWAAVHVCSCAVLWCRTRYTQMRTVRTMPMVLTPHPSKFEELRAMSSWDMNFGIPLPRSSASLGDLDQAAALATAVAIMLSDLFQQGLSSVMRRFVPLLFETLNPIARLFTLVRGKLQNDEASIPSTRA